MGLLLILLTLAATLLTYFRSNSSSPNPKLKVAHTVTVSVLLLFTMLVIMTGFIDISSISSCLIQFVPQVVFVVLGFLFAVPLVGACGVVVVRMVLERWVNGAGGVLGRVGSPGLEKENISRPLRGILKS